MYIERELYSRIQIRCCQCRWFALPFILLLSRCHVVTLRGENGLHHVVRWMVCIARLLV